MYTITSKLSPNFCKDQIILYRVDLNIDPQTAGANLRFVRLLPTIRLMLEYGARVVLVTHRGRPHGYDAALTTFELLPAFTEAGFNVSFIESITEVSHSAARLFLLENIRFDPREAAGDSSCCVALREHTTRYVFDAFGCAHRSDATIAQLPLLYQPYERTIGGLVELELQQLNKYVHHVAEAGIILGGGKADSKVRLAAQLAQQGARVYLIPGVDVAVRAACGESVGVTQVAPVDVQLAHNIRDQRSITLATDYLVRTEKGIDELKSTIISPAVEILSLGSQTVARISEDKERAWWLLNGVSGYMDQPETVHTYTDLVQRLVARGIPIVAGGGDSISFFVVRKFIDKLAFVSTGGGALLAYMAGERLPVLDILSSH